MCEDDDEDFPDHCAAEFTGESGDLWMCFLEDGHPGEHEFQRLNNDDERLLGFRP